MSTIHKMQLVAASAALAGVLAVTGCGTPGAPQPPSLNLPVQVDNLAANRAGNQVMLTWTMPKKNTDKLLLKGNVAVRVCRQQGEGTCAAAGGELSLAPGTDGSFTDTLPADLSAGAPRPLSYFVELKNRNGHSAGLSNAAVVVAGAAPAPVAGLTVEVRKQGVVLRWAKLDSATDAAAIRLHRKLLTPPPAKPHEGLLAPQPEPVEQNLLVEPCVAERHKDGCRALDKEIRFGQSYEYRAQRVARVTVNGKTLELAGEISAPVRVEVQDIFPPAVPTNLAAVATEGENGSAGAIDLSWQPVTDADLAGYAVYRCETGSAWQRVSPAEPLVPPAFHDAHVQPGHSYRYVVTSLAQNGHESARSDEAEETVPNP
jgi:hypothetical protein